jgi:hypothetical protein
VLREQVAELGQLNGLFVYDADGAWLVNSRPEPLPAHNNADREYFRFHRADPGRGAHVGTPVVSRSSGKWVIPVSRRINGADGRFAGVALATIDVDYFKRFCQSLDIGGRGAVALTSNAGTLLLRRPFDDATIGMGMARSALYLANRRQFDATLAREFGPAARGAAPLAFIMLDVDCFKQYNDHDGHVAGDACLRAPSGCVVALMPGRRGELAASWRRATAARKSGFSCPTPGSTRRWRWPSGCGWRSRACASATRAARPASSPSAPAWRRNWRGAAAGGGRQGAVRGQAGRAQPRPRRRPARIRPKRLTAAAYKTAP